VCVRWNGGNDVVMHRDSQGECFHGNRRNSVVAVCRNVHHSLPSDSPPPICDVLYTACSRWLSSIYRNSWAQNCVLYRSELSVLRAARRLRVTTSSVRIYNFTNERKLRKDVVLHHQYFAANKTCTIKHRHISYITFRI
jgi:hypothetical protein